MRGGVLWMTETIFVLVLRFTWCHSKLHRRGVYLLAVGELQVCTWELSDLTTSNTNTVVFHTTTLATALYNVFWDLCECPSGSGSSSDSNFPEAAFSFTHPLLFRPTAWLSQMGRITVIPAWCQVGDIDSHRSPYWSLCRHPRSPELTSTW